jgi:hypothetical protein
MERKSIRIGDQVMLSYCDLGIGMGSRYEAVVSGVTQLESIV